MRHIIFKTLLAITAMTCLSACEDFLSDRTEGTTIASDLDYSKPDNIFLPLSAAYASLRTYDMHDWAYINLLEIASDDADKGSTPEDGASSLEIDEFKYSAANTFLNSMWNGCYNAISAANYAIHSMTRFEASVPMIADREYARQCGAEARVIRAYAYFMLVRVFGRVYIADTTYTAAQLAALPQRTSAQIYDFIEKDLQDAINTPLPQEYSSEWAGRITLYTALGIKAKVHLYQQEWDSVAACAGRIIASGKYDLLPEFRDVFRSAGEYSSEMLFEIPSSTLGQASGGAPYLEYAFHQGPRNNEPSNMQGWGFCVPSQSLIDFFAERNDTVRSKVTIMEADNSGAKTGIMFEGSRIITCTACPRYYNGKVFTPPSQNKWAYNGYGFDYNVRILRYADILLMYAEALVRGGIDPLSAMTAQAALDKVRQRAKLGSIPATLETILDERRAELALEEDRFLDLVRQGKAAEVLGSKGFRAGKNEVYPIPNSQLQLNTGLTQNPNYN